MKTMRTKTKADRALDRPFAAGVLARARAIVDRYRIVLEKDKDLGYVGCALEFPTAWGDGRNPNACVRKTREALVAAVATMLEMGEEPPITSSGKRSEQINVRVTTEEKFRLERSARSKGFRGVSDFIRSTGLEHS